MKTQATIQKDIVFTQNLKLLTQTYEEISIMKMQKVRDSVIEVREFIDGLKDIYFDVKHSHQNQLTKAYQKSRQEEKGQAQSGNALVYISSNNKLAGNIVPNLHHQVKEKIREFKGSVFVIGQVGQEFISTDFPDRKIESYPLPASLDQLSSLKGLIETLLHFDSVSVFYGKFINLAQQKPEFTLISGDEVLAGEDPKLKQRLGAEFLFEPSLEEIARFFTLHIFASVFKQSFYESELAHLGSRITAMQSATDSIKKREKVLKAQALILRKRLSNKKQQQRMSGMGLWEK